MRDARSGQAHADLTERSSDGRHHFQLRTACGAGVAKNAIAQYTKIAEPHSASNGSVASTMSVGVATASVVPKNFDPGRMIERAARCLSAARLCGISAVKSIEV
jgi:hypothetical protein